MWSHDQLTAIDLGKPTVELDNLHEVGALEPLSVPLFHLAEDGCTIRNLIIKVLKLLLMLINVVNGIVGHEGYALPSLMHVAHGGDITAGLTWRYRTVPMGNTSCLSYG